MKNLKTCIDAILNPTLYTCFSREFHVTNIKKTDDGIRSPYLYIVEGKNIQEGYSDYMYVTLKNFGKIVVKKEKWSLNE